MEEDTQDYTLDRLHGLASQAGAQYLDLQLAEEELAAWIRNSNRGRQAVSEGSLTPALPPPNWDRPFHPQDHQAPHHNAQPQPQQLPAMNHQIDPQYAYQDIARPQGYYPPPPTSPGPSYYHAHARPFSSPEEPPNGSSSAYSYPTQYPSPSDLSPSSSTDPELKRIRNTAASARFRAKKKRREQSLERNAKEKREALQKLEDRIKELEAENKFLKGLIFDKEKMDGVKNELGRAKALKRKMEAGEGERDDGVGT